MKLWLVLAGTFWLSCLAVFAFMLAAFAGGGVANGGTVGTWGMRFLNFSLFALPGLCVVAAVMLWLAYSRDWGAVHYWWNAFPLPFMAAYVFVLLIAWK